jgi:hypothetical protein
LGRKLVVLGKIGRILDNLMDAIRGGGDPANIAISYHAARTEHERKDGDPKVFAEATRQRLAGLNDLSAYERGASEWPDRRAELLAEWKRGDAGSQALAAMLEKHTVIPAPEDIAEAETAMREQWAAALSPSEPTPASTAEPAKSWTSGLKRPGFAKTRTKGIPKT